ncbi:ATP-binding protein [bacterium]|nr:ATP-binding protein [bacterium]
MAHSILFSSSPTSEWSQTLATQLAEWDFSLVPFTDADSAWSTLSGDAPPEIFLFEWEEGFSESVLFLQTIWDTRHEFPFHAIVFGGNAAQEHLIELVGQAAHDFFLFPLDDQLLRAKLEVAKQIVIDRRVLAESAQVMERYAKHVDRLAAERARQLFHAERLSTLGTMSAGLAHEIKNPLGYISTSLETTKIYWGQISDLLLSIEETDNSDDKGSVPIDKILDRVPKALGRISNGLERIDKLMQGLKNFARNSQGAKKPHSINMCIETALEMCQTDLKYNTSVESNLAPDLPPLLIEPQQIEQVLINLLVNATHAMEGQKESRISIVTAFEKETVTVRVADNGPGIPRSKLETIWEPYYTTKEEGKGTGLGLAISKSLIRDNGGSITARNRTEGGAEFLMTFPVVPTEDRKESSST